MSTDYDDHGGGDFEDLDALDAYDPDELEDDDGAGDDSAVEEVAQEAYAEGVRAARQSQRYDAELDAIEQRHSLTDPEVQTLVIEDAMVMARRAGIEPSDPSFPAMIEEAAIARRGERIVASATAGRFRLGEQGR